MKEKASLLFGIGWISLLLICSLPLFAQTQDKTVARLKLENNRLRAIAEDKNTPSEIRELNQQLLIKNESLLREAILRSISALEDYQTKNADLLDDGDRKDINEKIEAHKYDLAQLGVIEIMKPRVETVSNSTASVKTGPTDTTQLIPTNFSPPAKPTRQAEEIVSNLKSGRQPTSTKLEKNNETIPISNKPNAPALRDDDPPFYDWGRVRGYFTSGVVFSNNRNIISDNGVTVVEKSNFSKPDIYLDFTLDKNYAARRNDHERPLGIFDDLNTFFTARLTTIGVSQKADPEGEGDDEEKCTSAECQTFLASEKAARLAAGIYLPRYFTWWKRQDGNPDEDEDTNKWSNALFVAPLIKGGIQTIVGDRNNSTSEGRSFGGDDIYNFYSMGVLIGHNKLFKSKRDFAPELISYLSVTYGRFENFEYLDPDGPKDAEGNLLRRVRPWRYEAVGRLKVPETPIVIGFDGNFGRGPDDLRFILGVRFDIGNVLKTLKGEK